MAYTSVSKTDERKLVRVQLPSSAPILKFTPEIYSQPELILMKEMLNYGR